MSTSASSDSDFEARVRAEVERRLADAAAADSDERTRVEQRLQESEARYRLLAENSNDVIILLDQHGRRSYVSPACKTVLGYSVEEMLASTSQSLIHPDDATEMLRILAKGCRDDGDPEVTVHYRLRHKNGNYLWVEAAGRALDAVGQPGQRMVIVRDISERKQAEQQLKESEARYRLLADNSTDMVLQLGTDLLCHYISPACREVLGHAPKDVIGRNPVNNVHPNEAAVVSLALQTLLSGKADRYTLISRNRHRDGRWIWVEATLRTLKDPGTGAVTGIIGALRDISARKAVEDDLARATRRLQALAGQDGLTGLANRRTFDEVLAKKHQRSRHEQTELALVMIDVDRFKRFNDIYGHLAGDDCLRRVGAAIGEAITRCGGLAARYGGEEFAVLLPRTNEARASVIAERIRQAISSLDIAHTANANERVTISAGVASSFCTEIEAEALLDAADRALYCAKDSGRNTVIRASGVTNRPGPSVAVA